mmetsp:Transcript_9142/g.22781  ORF Transcript_9142/g.22781 Transcript_9142/m.22781 type:complete len:346 (+) Transcript_9142:196-1233(+)
MSVALSQPYESDRSCLESVDLGSAGPVPDGSFSEAGSTSARPPKHLKTLRESHREGKLTDDEFWNAVRQHEREHQRVEYAEERSTLAGRVDARAAAEEYWDDQEELRVHTWDQARRGHRDKARGDHRDQARRDHRKVDVEREGGDVEEGRGYREDGGESELYREEYRESDYKSRDRGSKKSRKSRRMADYLVDLEDQVDGGFEVDDLCGFSDRASVHSSRLKLGKKDSRDATIEKLMKKIGMLHAMGPKQPAYHAETSEEDARDVAIEMLLKRVGMLSESAPAPTFYGGRGDESVKGNSGKSGELLMFGSLIVVLIMFLTMCLIVYSNTALEGMRMTRGLVKFEK